MPIYLTTINVTLNEKTELEILAPNQETAYNIAAEQAENIFIHEGAANELLHIQITNPIEKPTPINNEIETGYVSLKDLRNRSAGETTQADNTYTRFFS